MKVAVLGIGRMGTAISYAMRKLGFYVLGLDSNEVAGEHFRKHISGADGAFYVTDQNNADKSMERFILYEKPDIVISSLPYHQTEEIAYWCIANEFRYCDLGGRVDVSLAINKEAKEKAKVPVMTDLGLAPGWVNILAEWGYGVTHGSDTVEMMVGGLPISRDNPPLNYATTWSIDGLINEYKDDCLVLEKNEINTVRGMDGLVEVETQNLGTLEAFYTSGGASHTLEAMKDRGVKNCSYRTLRYKGHRDVIKFLIENQNEDCVREVIERGCKPEGGDLVILLARIVGGHRDGRLSWNKEIVVHGDSEFSAMQRATAFPISSVASMMAEGLFDRESRKIERRGYYEYPKSEALTYKDISEQFASFNERLDRLDLQGIESENVSQG